MTLKIRRIEQWLAGFAPGDAVSQDALAIRAASEAAGIACVLRAPAAAIAREGRPLCEPLPDPAGDTAETSDTTLRLYHYAIGSPLTERFLQTPRPRLLRYHNITPAWFFAGYDDRLARRLRQGRSELRQAADAADAIWAVSRFNANDITGPAQARTTVWPLLFSPERLALPADPVLRQRLRRGDFVNILTVGRIAPNKRLEDLILAFDVYQRAIHPRSRLLIVGSTRSCPRYYGMLWMLAAALDNPAICFEGFPGDAALNAYYQAADLYVCTSAHEGYGAPLIEAMAHGIPVLARHTGGMPEAMDGAGILFDDPTPATLAELMHIAISDTGLRTAIRNAQTERMTRWRHRDPAAELTALLTAMRPAAGHASG